MTDYTEFDKALVAKVAGGRGTFAGIRGGNLEALADEIGGKSRYGDKQGWRVIDRRLQALKKSGKLVYDRQTGWKTA